MPEDRLSQLRKGYAEEDYSAWSRRISGLCGRSPRLPSSSRRWPGWPMPMAVRCPAYDPLTPLARDIAGALTEAGFTLHHCAQGHPLYRLGGVLPGACRTWS